MKVKYADGLVVDFTEKELDKITEIKARVNRNPQDKNKIIQWAGREKNEELTLEHVRRVEVRRKKNRALILLYECGYPIIRIAEMFNITEKEIRGIIRRGALGQL